jgi:DNA-binding NtrC family response regulator
MGVHDIILKPLSPSSLTLLLKKAARTRLLLQENEHYRGRLVEPGQEMIGRSENIRAVFSQVDKTADVSRCLLIAGPHGTGKHLLARVLHRRFFPRSAPFIHVDCAAHHGRMLERELFGDQPGEVNGNGESLAGAFELAEGGMLVLDSIAEMDLPIQARLLPLLDQVEARGTTRVLCVSSRNLAEMAKEGLFSAELFERLNRNTIRLPSLKERAEDVVLLAEYFLRHFANENSLPKAAMDSGVRAAVTDHEWPGNVRELRDWAEQMTFSAARANASLRDTAARTPAQAGNPSASVAATPDAAAHNSVAAGTAAPARDANAVTFRVGQSLDEVESVLIQRTVEALHGNRTKAAQVLGISVRTLYTKLLEIERAQKHGGAAGDDTVAKNREISEPAMAK